MWSGRGVPARHEDHDRWQHTVATHGHQEMAAQSCTRVTTHKQLRGLWGGGGMFVSPFLGLVFIINYIYYCSGVFGVIGSIHRKDREVSSH